MPKKHKSLARELKALQKTVTQGNTFSRKLRSRSRQESEAEAGEGPSSNKVMVSRRLTPLRRRGLRSNWSKNDASNSEKDDVAVVKVEPESHSSADECDEDSTDVGPGSGSTRSTVQLDDSDLETEPEKCDEEEDELDVEQDHHRDQSDHHGGGFKFNNHDKSHDIRKLVESPSPGSSGGGVILRAKSAKGLPKPRARKVKYKWCNVKDKRKKLSEWRVIDKDGNKMTDAKITFACQKNELHFHQQQIYGCRFLYRKMQDYNYFATVGANRVTVYRCDNNSSVQDIQRYVDHNKNEVEVFYCCAWSNDLNDKLLLLAAAGKNGIIRIFSTVDAQCLYNLIGHGGSINDIKFHPRDHNLLFTASEDRKVRLWNVKTQVLVAIFGGHSHEVLHLDIHATPITSRMISCGMDGALKIWDLMKPKITQAIKRSRKYDLDTAERAFVTHKQNVPDFTTMDVHVHLNNYIDCVKWFGDFLFSKSVNNEIVYWKPGQTLQTWDQALDSRKISVIQLLELKNCELWFIKFDLDLHRLRLACGNESGKIYLFEMFDDLDLTKVRVLEHPDCKTTIREVCFSEDGKILIAVCDDATIWRWNINH